MFSRSLDRWQEIYDVLRKNKLRTSLTALSVAWGIFMLVILLGAGRGLENSVVHDFKDDAVNSIWLWAGETSIPYKGHAVGRDIRFDNHDYELLRTVGGVDKVTGRFYLPGRAAVVTYGDKHTSYEVRAVHPDHRYLENTTMTAGRFINQLDLDGRRKVCVIGTAVIDFLFEGEPPIGKAIEINGLIFKVVGTFNDDGGDDENRKIYLPITTAQIAFSGHDRINRLMFTVGNADVPTSQAIAAVVTERIAGNHDFSPDDDKAIRVRNNVENYQRVTQIFAMISAFIWIIGAGTVVAGIVGVSNIMMISVKERTREIGLRKAIGATPWSIIGTILREAVVLTSVAGYMGMVAGIGFLELVSRAMGDNDYLRDPQVDLTVVLTAMGLLVFFGALAGFFPARRAAKVNPIVALRDE